MQCREAAHFCSPEQFHTQPISFFYSDHTLHLRWEETKTIFLVMSQFHLKLNHRHREEKSAGLLCPLADTGSLTRVFSLPQTSPLCANDWTPRLKLQVNRHCLGTFSSPIIQARRDRHNGGKTCAWRDALLKISSMLHVSWGGKKKSVTFYARKVATKNTDIMQHLQQLNHHISKQAANPTKASVPSDDFVSICLNVCIQ